MIYKIAANITILIHFSFICFVVVGGFLALRWRWLIFIHLPCVVWGALIEFRGWICPLTPLENWFRELSGSSGYNVGFIEHYLLPVIYPTGLTREIQIILGGFVVLVNLIAYVFYTLRIHKKKFK